MQSHPNIKIVFVEADLKMQVSKLPIVDVPVVDPSTMKRTLVQHGISKGMVESLFSLYGSDVEIIDCEVNRGNFERSIIELLAPEVARIRRLEE